LKLYGWLPDARVNVCEWPDTVRVKVNPTSSGSVTAASTTAVRDMVADMWQPVTATDGFRLGAGALVVVVLAGAGAVVVLTGAGAVVVLIGAGAEVEVVLAGADVVLAGAGAVVVVFAGVEVELVASAGVGATDAVGLATGLAVVGEADVRTGADDDGVAVVIGLATVVQLLRATHPRMAMAAVRVRDISGFLPGG
jgi:hypothetical protein